MVKDMVQAGCEVWTADVVVGHALDVPWGFVVAECTLNGETHAGARWMSFLDEITPTFSSLSAYVLPNDTTIVKAGTAAHFLVKIIGHLEEGNTNESVQTNEKRSHREEAKSNR